MSLQEYKLRAERMGLDRVAEAAGVPLVITVNEETAVLVQVHFAINLDDEPAVEPEYTTLREYSR